VQGCEWRIENAEQSQRQDGNQFIFHDSFGRRFIALKTGVARIRGSRPANQKWLRQPEGFRHHKQPQAINNDNPMIMVHVGKPAMLLVLTAR
jgi:hypothetical protein